MAIIVGALVSWILGCILLFIFVMITITLVVLYYFLKNKFYRSLFLKNFLAIIAAIVGAVGWLSILLSDRVTSFEGLTITYFSIMGFLVVYGFVIFVRDYRNRDLEPLFFSPWVFPIYKYDARNEKIMSHNRVG